MQNSLQITDFNMPFGSIVTFMIKFYFASALAGLVVFGIVFGITMVFGLSGAFLASMNL